jgi:hypothetical protein
MSMVRNEDLITSKNLSNKPDRFWKPVRFTFGFYLILIPYLELVFVDNPEDGFTFYIFITF